MSTLGAIRSKLDTTAIKDQYAIVAILVGLVFFMLVQYIVNQYIVSVFFGIMLTITLASSWNLFSGYTGYLSFGHVGFFGIGAYSVGVLAMNVDFNIYIMVLAGGALGMILSLPLILVTIRLSGVYFAIMMFAFAEIMLEMAVTLDDITGGTSGMVLSISPSQETIYLLMAILTGFTVLVSLLASRSSFGLALKAIRDDEEVVGSVGINSTKFKAITLSLSALIQGLAGGIAAAYWIFISPNSVFSTFLSIDMIMAAILGGIGTVFGPVVGAIVLVLVRSETQASYPYIFGILFGLLLMIIVLTIPEGIIAYVKDAVERFSAE